MPRLLGPVCHRPRPNRTVEAAVAGVSTGRKANTCGLYRIADGISNPAFLNSFGCLTSGNPASNQLRSVDGSCPSPVSNIWRLECAGGDAISISHGNRVGHRIEITVCAQMHIVDAEALSGWLERMALLGRRRRRPIAWPRLRTVIGENAEPG